MKMASSSKRTMISLATAAVVIMAMTKMRGTAAAVDCSTLILNMADCLSFVTSGSTVEKPEGTCCSGLKTVIRSGPQCLCEAFKSSASMGVTLNVTKSASLPSACKVAAPPSARCGLSVGPPASAPGASPTPASAGAPPPEESTGASAAAPAPGPAISPGSSSSSSSSSSSGPPSLLYLSVASLINGLLVVLFSCF